METEKHKSSVFQRKSFKPLDRVLFCSLVSIGTVKNISKNGHRVKQQKTDFFFQ